MNILDGFSIEALPRTASRIADFRELLPAGTRIYIAHVPGTPIDDMVSAGGRLRSQGFPVMPHIPARLIAGRRTLEDWLARYRDAGVDEALAIAGSVSAPAGEFSGGIDLLETGLFDRRGFCRLHVAGHPEGNRDIDPDGGTRRADDAAVWKDNFASARTDCEMALVTQFAFDAAPIIDWSIRLQDMGVRLPVHVGIGGPAKLGTLIRFALGCGVGASVSVLRKRGRDLTRVLRGHEPTEIVAALDAFKLANPQSNIAGIHLFPFGGIAASAEWAAGARRSAARPQPGPLPRGKRPSDEDGDPVRVPGPGRQRQSLPSPAN